MIVAGIFLLAALVGWGAVSRLPVTLGPTDRAFWALPLGLEILAVTAFFLSWVLGAVETAVAVTGVLGLGFGVYSLISKKKTLGDRQSGRIGDFLPYLVVLVPWVLFSVVAYPGMVVWRDGGLVSGWANVWADWSAHLRSSTFLATQNPFTLENSLLSGVPARYPLLETFQSSVFQRVGLDPVTALLWSGFPFFALFPVLVVSFFRGLGLRPWVAALGSALFVFSGGFGIFNLVQDLASGLSWPTDPYHTRLYTDIKDSAGTQTLGSIWFINFVTSEFVPQRAFLFGMPWALLTFLGFWQNFAVRPTREHKISTAVVLGLAWGALLLFHTHSAVALGLVMGLVALTTLGKELLAKEKIQGVPGVVFAGTALGMGATIFTLFLMDPVKIGGMVRFIGGWVPGPADLPGVLLFLLRNLGILLVTSLLIFMVPHYRVRLLGAGALAVLVTANLVAFQPWVWDNMKLLTWWYLLAVAVSLLGAQAVWDRVKKPILRVLMAVVSGLAVILATGAGLWDVAEMGTMAANPQLGLAPPDGVAFAGFVREYFRANPDQARAVVAIAPAHNHPVALLGGTRIYLGYAGWLWSYGLDYQDRSEVQKTVFTGGPEALAAARKAGIGYVVSGPTDAQFYGTPRVPLGLTFPPVLSTGRWSLLKVP